MATNWRNTGGFDPAWYLLANRVTLLANKWYRLTIKPTTTNSLSMQEYQVNANVNLDGMPGGKNMYLTTRTDAGAWTDTTTRRPMIGLLVEQLSDGYAGLFHNF